LLSELIFDPQLQRQHYYLWDLMIKDLPLHLFHAFPAISPTESYDANKLMKHASFLENLPFALFVQSLKSQHVEIYSTNMGGGGCIMTEKEAKKEKPTKEKKLTLKVSAMSPALAFRQAPKYVQRTAERTANRAASRTANRAAERTANRAAERTANRAAERTANRAAERTANRAAARTANRVAARTANRAAARTANRNALRSAE
jgi:hypothetical protein